MFWERKTHTSLLLLTVVLGINIEHVHTSPTTSVAQNLTVYANTTFPGPTHPDTAGTGKDNFPKIVFVKKGELSLSPAQLNQFLQCLCDNSTKDCFMYSTMSKDTPASNKATKNHKVTEVRELPQAQDSNLNDANLQNTTSSYTCNFFTSSLIDVLYCADKENGTYNIGETSNVIEQVPTNFYATCSFKCVTLQWKTDVDYFNFGQGPVIVKDNRMSFSFSGGIEYGNSSLCDGTTNTDDDDGSNNNDVGGGNVLNGNPLSVADIAENSETDKTTTETTGDNGEKADGEKRNECHSDWFATTVNTNPKLFVALFVVSLAVNLILLLICICLCVAKQREVDLSSLPPIVFSEPRDNDKQWSISEPINDSLNTSYQAIDNEDINAIKLRSRDDGEYLTPREVEAFTGDGDDVTSPDTTDTGRSSTSTSRRGQEFDDVSLSDTEQNPVKHIGQKHDTRTSHIYSNWSNSLGRPKEHAIEMVRRDGTASRTRRIGSGITRRKEIISAFFRSPFTRRRFNTHAADGTDPMNSSQNEPQADRMQENREADASGTRSSVAKTRDHRKKPVPRKPRRSRENFPRLTHDTSQYRQKSNTVPAPGEEPQGQTFQNNLAFTSAQSDENVYNYMRDRTSSVYCNL